MLRKLKCHRCKHIHPIRHSFDDTCDILPQGTLDAQRIYHQDEEISPEDLAKCSFEERDPFYKREDILRLIETNDPEYLPDIARMIAIYEVNSWGEQTLLKLCQHEVEYVRWNALYSLANFVNRGAKIREKDFRTVVEQGLNAQMGSTVFAAALTAAIAIERKLGWNLNAKEVEKQYHNRLSENANQKQPTLMELLVDYEAKRTKREAVGR